MNLKWTTQSLWFYIFSHTNCLVKPLHFTQMLYSHAIRPWIHSSSACIELNMLSIDLPVSREQTRGHVKVSVCVWEGEGDEKGPGRVSKSKEWERKERESSVCILDQWESERHCSSFRNTLWSNRFLPSAAFTCVFISSWFSRYSELYISPVLAAFAQEASLTSLTKKRLYSSNVTPVLQHWSEQRCPELSLLRNFLQFSQTIPRCSQSQLRDISSPVCPGFPISWMYLKHAQEASYFKVEQSPGSASRSIDHTNTKKKKLKLNKCHHIWLCVSLTAWHTLFISCLDVLSMLCFDM